MDKWLVGIAVAIVAIVIFSVMLFSIPGMTDWAKNIIFGLSGEGGVIQAGTEEASALHAAIKCSYFRCMDGCGKESVKNIPIGSKNCDTNYCVPYQKDGKVCGDDAKANPVKVTIPNNQVIIKEKLKVGDLGGCVIKSDSCNTQFAMKGWVNIQKDAIVEKQWEVTTCPYIRTQVQGYNKVVVNAGRYEVWTTQAAGLLGGLTTVVCFK